jgi:hypothetical protein
VSGAACTVEIEMNEANNAGTTNFSIRHFLGLQGNYGRGMKRNAPETSRTETYNNQSVKEFPARAYFFRIRDEG